MRGSILPCIGSVLLGVALLSSGCGGPEEICCTDVDQVASELEPEVQPRYYAAIRASRSMTLAGRGAWNDVTTACHNLAVDLDGDPSAIAKALALADDTDSTLALCTEASYAIQRLIPQGLRVSYAPPSCAVSVGDSQACRAQCGPASPADCDVRANPPRCTGGKLEVSCAGVCRAAMGDTVTCRGTCEGQCAGKCLATNGVLCVGSCDGTCSAIAGTAGSGIQSDGTCQGECKGNCSAIAVGATCEGFCEGACKGACRGSPGARVRCDGTCEGENDVLSCNGGKLEGGCAVDPKCEANCDVALDAETRCTLPELTLVPGRAAPQYMASLRSNLPRLLVFGGARGIALARQMRTVTAAMVGSVTGDLGRDGQACLFALGDRSVNGVVEMNAAVQGAAVVVEGLKRAVP